MKHTIAVVTFVWFAALNCFAWSSAGHQTIAAIAYANLSPALQARVGESLKAHPDYSKWEQSYKPGTVSLPLYVFMRASVWPDEIRRKHNSYDHPHWHYVDHPLRPPGFPLELAPTSKDDVLYGIAQSGKIVGDPKSSAEERAVYLSYLIHLIGDVHQPLHCVSLFDAHFPSGDKGGNSYWIKPATRAIKLHSFWDGLLGTSGSPQTHVNYAARIGSAYPRKSQIELAKPTPKDWSLEGRTLALDKAYLRCSIEGGMSEVNPVILPPSYTTTAKTVAEKQAALAGYRLAGEIARFIR
jgi:hypothetical protein